MAIYPLFLFGIMVLVLGLLIFFVKMARSKRPKAGDGLRKGADAARGASYEKIHSPRYFWHPMNVHYSDSASRIDDS